MKIVYSTKEIIHIQKNLYRYIDTCIDYIQILHIDADIDVYIFETPQILKQGLIVIN